MKSKVVRALAIVAILIAGLCIYLSLTWEQRTLKLVLKIDEIPSSVKVLEMQEDAWTDYVVRGRFTIHPEDLPMILKGRDFTLTTWPPEHVKRRDGRAMNHWYLASGSRVHLRLYVDEKKEFVEFSYGAD